MKFKKGNIWSGAKGGLAVMTNPTEIAFRKGNLISHYPVTVHGRAFPDAEAAYQSGKRHFGNSNDLLALEAIMAEIIACKLRQHPRILEVIETSGGIPFIEACNHHVNGGRWEGDGKESPFIKALIVGCQVAFAKRI